MTTTRASFRLGRRAAPAAVRGVQDLVVDFDTLQIHNCGLWRQITHTAVWETTLKKAGSKEAFARVDHDYVVDFAQGLVHIVSDSLW